MGLTVQCYQRDPLVPFYAVFGFQAFLYQAFIRLEQCSGFGRCSLSLVKDAVWSLVWPVYWLGHFLLF